MSAEPPPTTPAALGPAPAVAVAPSSSVARREHRSGLVLVALGGVAAMGSLAIDLYIPSFPRIGAELGVSDSLVQTTLTGAMVGFAIGQLALGPVIDRVGRRRPLLIAHAVLVVTAVVCAVAPTIGVLTGARVLQGMACAAGAVVATATARDLYQGRAFVRAVGHIVAITAAVPVLAPSVGGLLLAVVSWRGLFLAIALITVLATLAYLVLVPETAPIAATRPAGRVLGGYRRVLADRRYVALTALTVLVWGAGTWTYVTASPFVFQRVWDLSPTQFGLIFGLNALSGWLGVQIGARLSVRFSSGAVVGACTGAGAGAMALLWLGSVTGVIGLVGVELTIALLYLVAGMMMPHISHLSLEHLGDAAGAATALPGALTLAVASVVAPVTASFGTDALAPMATSMLVAMLAAVVVFLIGVRPRLGAAGTEPGVEP